jgi:hypothetical protein
MNKFIKHLPLGIFCLYFSKVYLQAISYPEVGILLVLAGIAGYFEYKSNDQKLTSLEARIDKQQAQLDLKEKELEIIKTTMASLKLSTGMRQVNQR